MPTHCTAVQVGQHGSLEQAVDAAAQLLGEEASKPLDIIGGMLVRLTHVELEGSDRRYLQLCIHHSLIDGAGWDVLLRDLAAIYRSVEAAGLSCSHATATANLPPLGVQYRDYAAWQSQQDFTQGLAYWQQHLEGAPTAVSLHADLPRSTNTLAGKGGIASLEVPAEIFAQLQRLAARHGCTLFMVLLGGVSLLLQRYSQQDDMVVGTPFVNRPSQQLRELVGCFINMLPLRVHVSEKETLAKFMRQLRSTVAGGMQHGDVPYLQVSQAVRGSDDISGTGLYNVVLVLQDAANQAVQAEGRNDKHSWELPHMPNREGQQAQLDLTWNMVPDSKSGTLHVSLVYKTDMLAEQTAQRMLQHLQVTAQGSWWSACRARRVDSFANPDWVL